jgi:hypothetical protein
MKLQMPVDKLVVTLVGYTFEFKKNTPVDVPAAAVKDCLAAGAHLVQGEVLDAEETKIAVQLEGPERITALAKQIRSMVARNKRGDFTGAGKPDAVVMSKDLGFQVFAGERDEVWADVRLTIGEEAVE